MIHFQYIRPTTPIHRSYIKIYRESTPEQKILGDDIGTINIAYNNQTKAIQIDHADYLRHNGSSTPISVPSTIYHGFDHLINDIIALYHPYDSNIHGTIIVGHYTDQAEWGSTTIRFAEKNNNISITYTHQHRAHSLAHTRIAITNIPHTHNIATLHNAFYALQQAHTLPPQNPLYNYHNEYIEHYTYYNDENENDHLQTSIGKTLFGNKIAFHIYHNLEDSYKATELPLPNNPQNIQKIILELNDIANREITTYNENTHISQHEKIQQMRNIQQKIRTNHAKHIALMQDMQKEYYQHYT